MLRYWRAQNLKTIRRGQVGASGVGWSQVGPFLSHRYCDGIENVALRQAVALMALVSRIVENHSSTITEVVHKLNALGISHWKSQEKHTMHRKSQVIQSLACLPLPRATRGQEESWMLTTMPPILSKSSLHSKFSQTRSQASRLTPCGSKLWILGWLILFGCRFYFSTSRSWPQLVNSGWFCPRFGG